MTGDLLDVWLDGLLAGRLNRATDGQVVFDYHPDAPPTALSASMPRSTTHHGPDVVMPWLDNLLPDNDDVRARWATRFGLRRVTPFDLLTHMGVDCAGAVQILPGGHIPDQTGTLTPLDETEIADHIRTLRADAAAWDFPDQGGRWSLGGQQGKFALAYDPGRGWLLPSGRAASTHIFKVGVAGVPDSDVAEFVTMRTAALLGLPVAPVAYRTFDGEPVLVATRFDRLTTATGVRRVHQEDLCQAMGLWRTMKYQADGGPSPTDIADMLRRTLDPRDRQHGVETFARALVFNWLMAGADAHAKNYAVLHIGSRITLAPLYDLLGAAFLWPAKQTHYEGRLAMKFGGEYRLRKVDLGRIPQAATDLGVDPAFLAGVARDYHQQLPGAVTAALCDLPAAVGQASRDRLLGAITDRLAWTRTM